MGLYTDHRLQLKSELAGLDSSRRIVFAFWCVERLLYVFENSLEERIGKGLIERMKSAIDLIWDAVAEEQVIGIQGLQNLYEELLAVTWDELDEDEVSEVAYGCLQTIEALIEALEVAMDNNQNSAIAAGQKLIFWKDYVVTMIDGDTNPESSATMIQEVATQLQMLKLLDSDTVVFNELRKTIGQPPASAE